MKPLDQGHIDTVVVVATIVFGVDRIVVLNSIIVVVVDDVVGGGYEVKVVVEVVLEEVVVEVQEVVVVRELGSARCTSSPSDPGKVAAVNAFGRQSFRFEIVSSLT
ncbi:hypothetical protein DPMN_106370 [Dreissena polymorpha]|uniref:Uncharacterized protein n=1 Tax=Dreissena polymorpha TaxID=45954 RepID=A0A9D4QIS0_DREPO|nr:hypothetical protein DPMN_106370 [Dreissena polymorpha]